VRFPRRLADHLGKLLHPGAVDFGEVDVLRILPLQAGDLGASSNRSAEFGASLLFLNCRCRLRRQRLPRLRTICFWIGMAGSPIFELKRERIATAAVFEQLDRRATGGRLHRLDSAHDRLRLAV
jgi:hypothetical protein